MISHFFIDRPIFAAVLSIVITLVGGIALVSLPIAQYPPIAPPTVQVSCTYPGASAQVVADTVAAPIEQQVNGVDRMLYMSSQSANDGTYNLTVTFDLGTDLNTALVMVQNRVSLAMPQLPDVVQKQGLTIKKKSPNILLVVNLWSPDGRYDDLYLSNYATINVKDELFRLPGIGDITYLGERDYSIRVWLDPQLLAARNLTAGEVADAIANQSQPVAAGQVGQQPAPPGQSMELPLTGLGRLTTPEQFGDLIVKTVNGQEMGSAPKIVRLRDVARVELGAQQYDQAALLNGQPAVGLAIFQLPGTNALDVAEGVNNKMQELSARFPEGLAYSIAYDTTPFIRQSVDEVFKTLRDAIILVAIVVLVFLQNWRAALIPLVAVPVAIIGTFAAMAAMGFSLNNISLFGLVLAIGIVVDDAIVVVENVERWLEQGLPARDAARKAMSEVTGPVVAVAVVLCAVFVPAAFISGITGQFFRQFAITIAVSTVISAFNSLTLSPALASLLLKPRTAKPDLLTRAMNLLFGWFFTLFNRSFSAATNAYSRFVGLLLRGSVIVLVLFGGLLALTGYTFSIAPTGFIPQQDQGWLLVNIQLPDSSSVQRTQAVMRRVDELARQDPGVAHTTGVAGQSFLLMANSNSFGSVFVVLKPFEQRRDKSLGANEVLMRLRAKFRQEIPEANVAVFSAPPVPGIGMASGFKLMVENRHNLTNADLQKFTDDLVTKARESKLRLSKDREIHALVGVFTLFRANIPQLYMDVDRTKARALGVTIRDVDRTLQTFLGSYYVNNFNQFGRFWQVNLMAEGTFRNRTDRLSQLWMRNRFGQMVPLSTVVDTRTSEGPILAIRYNLYPAAPVNGMVLPVFSSGQAISLMEELAAKTLPQGMKIEWTDLTFMQIKAGNTAMFVFGLAVVFVFLSLAALYESWSLPLAVILVVPMCLLCSVVGVLLSHKDVNIFTQIGFVVLVGLASKNAILIVEFAKQLREEGKGVFESTTEACRLRLRPIMMTSFAFILGVVPLVVAEGAGAEMRQALGTAVFSGMLGVTFFGVLLTPVFFYVIQRFGESRLFQSPAMQRVGWLLRILASIATLGLFNLAGRLIKPRPAAPPPTPPGAPDHDQHRENPR